MPDTRARRPDRGQVLPMVAIVLTVLITCASVAIDLGYQRVERRDMQAVADVVAIDLSRLVNGSTAAALATTMQNAAATSASRNGHPVSAADVAVLYGNASNACRGSGHITGRCLVVEMGTTDANRTFTPLASSAGTPTAVRVTAGTEVAYFFRPGTGDARRTAVGSTQPKAQFEVGAFLANAGGVEGSLIDQLFDNGLGLNVLSPNGLVNSNIGVRQLQLAIGLLQPGAGANTQLTARDFLLLGAKAAELGGDTANATLLNNAAALANRTNTQLTVGQLTQMYFQGSDAVLGGSVNLFGYLQSGIALMNGSTVLSLSNAGISLAGLANPTLSVSVVQPSTMSAYGPVGIEAANQQLGFAIRPNIATTGNGSVNSCDVQNLSALIGGLLSCILGIGGIILGNSAIPVGVSVNSGSSTMQVTGARAVGRLTAIGCAASPSITVTPVSFTPAAVTTNLSFTGTVTVGNLNRTFTVTQPVSFGLAGSASAQTFLDPSQFNQPRNVGSTNVGFANSVVVGAATVTYTGGSPLAGATLTTFNNVVAPIVSNTITAALSPVLNGLDDLVSTIATQIGINVGGAAITAHLRECLSPSLVG